MHIGQQRYIQKLIIIIKSELRYVNACKHEKKNISKSPYITTFLFNSSRFLFFSVDVAGCLETSWIRARYVCLFFSCFSI
jgi:hypothetical protein